MTLHDLAEHLSPQFPASVQKDVKTAVRCLAQALNTPDAKSCPLEVYLMPVPTLYRRVETFLTTQGKSAHTIRNTKNNLSRLFRLAEARQLFSPPPLTPTRRFNTAILPHRSTKERYCRPDGSHFRRQHWPREVEHEFARFYKWATDELVDGREAKWKKRPQTMRLYEELFETYFGYLHHQLHLDPIQFDHIFNVTLIDQFVRWHINEKCHRPTRAAHEIVKTVQAMAKQYRPDPQVVDAMRTLRRQLPKLRPVYNKQDVWLPLHELERLGMALWPTRSLHVMQVKNPPHQHTGRVAAARAGLSLMLRLWVYIPYRQRNMRELRKPENLYQTPEGQWRIRFAGEQLKVAVKRGQENVFDLPFPPALVPVLEEYLAMWRPVLAEIHGIPELFLNAYGHCYSGKILRQSLQRQIYAFTGRHWHPHIIRTVWATEWISNGGDFMTAAIMLNDRLETVIANYAHLRDENVAEKAFEWVQSRVNHH